MNNDIIEELFKKYYNDALLYTLSMTKDPATAEEIVSDAYFIALKTSNKEIQNFKAWLLKVCRNLFLNSLRKTNRLRELDENTIVESQNIIDNIIKEEKYKELYHAISLLNSSYKEVITLFYFEDLSIKEISQVIDKNESVVKVTLHRARQTLKKNLTKIN